MTAEQRALVRVARREDAAAIAHIYNHGIEERIESLRNRSRRPPLTSSVSSTSASAVIRPSWSNAMARSLPGPPRATTVRGRATTRSPSTLSMSSAAIVAVAPRAWRSRCCAPKRSGWAFLKLVSRIFPENVASLALHRKAGLSRGRHLSPPRQGRRRLARLRDRREASRRSR